MSSRSFRRRNSRRRRQGMPGGFPGAPGGSPSGPAPDGASGSAGPGSPGRQGERAPRQGSGPGGRGGSRGRARQGRPAPAPQEPVAVAPPIPAPDCPVCGKPVRELASALTHRVSRQPAHFDCVMRELRESNEVAPQEKICYLGGGSFGILEFRPQGSANRFVIRKRIQYEEKEIPQEWKKLLLVSC
jgi:hypothetical protein